MSNPPVPPADGYSEAIGNGHQTVNLVSAFVGLVGQPLSSAWARRQAHAALCKGLGEWAEEAFDTDNQCQQPVLREEAFVTHLIENQAAFCPSGSCSATFAWAKLLYSLDIRPGNNIIEWQPLATDADPYESGALELELEGPVLCHIVNLYQIYDGPYGASLRELYDRGVTWPFSFGALRIYPRHHNTEDNSAAGRAPEPRLWTVTFRPHSNRALSATRQPFVTAFQDHLAWSGGPLAFESNSVAINYVSTAKHSAYSDSVLGLPSSKDALQKRCLSLCGCLAALEPSGSTPSKPFLVTPSWIEQANRIKRRLTTDGGADNGLADYTVEFLSREPTVVKEITDILPERLFRGGRYVSRTPESWKKEVWGEVKNLCFYEKDTFEFIWRNNDYSPPQIGMLVVGRELPRVLSSLSQEPPTKWLTALGEMVPEVMKILDCRHFVNRPVLVLSLTADHPLWRSSYYVQGQIPTY